MAWQSSAAMVGNGGSPGGGEGSSQGSQPQGTEYTLQGVMRFLQTEWHKHERDRNAWEIERAEMKNRIGKLEGEGRTSKRMQESLGKHIKLLEVALRKEREKFKKLQAGQQVDEQKLDAREVKDFAKSEYAAPASKGPSAVDSVDVKMGRASPLGSRNRPENGDNLHNEFRQDIEREKSRHYLQKCLQELTYHTLSTQLSSMEEQHEPGLHEQQYGNQLLPQQSADVYVPNQRLRQQGNPAATGPAAMSSQQVAGMSRASEARAAPSQSRLMEGASNAPGAISVSNLNLRDHARRPAEETTITEDPIESFSHSYDSYGQPVASRDEQDAVRSGQAVEVNDPNGWNFEPTVTNLDEGLPEYSTLPQRPYQESFPQTDGISERGSPSNSNGRRRQASLSKRRTSDGTHEGRALSLNQDVGSMRSDATFKIRFALRGHVDVVRSVIFTGGGSPSEPEICTTGDDGVIKRWTIPATYGAFNSHSSSSSASDLDVSSYFTHRGHAGPVLCLAAAPASQSILNGGRAQGDGWVFSGGQDGTVRVWERGRVDPKATLDGHSDAIWSICVLPGTTGSILGDQCSRHGGPDRILIASGAADGTILIWAVSSPPQLTSPSTTGSRRLGGGGRRANSVSGGSQFPSSPQATTATTTPFNYSLVHRIEHSSGSAPTCITPLSPSGSSFVVGYSDSSISIFDSRSGEKITSMLSQETYDGTPDTAINAVAATALGALSSTSPSSSSPGSAADRREEDEKRGATGGSSGVEGIVLSGHEDKFIRFFDANSGKHSSVYPSGSEKVLTDKGQCTYSMIAHQSAISALSLSPDGLELVSAGHDASLRFWSLEKRTCTQEITSHRPMRGEGVCDVVWSVDGRWVVSGGGDGVVKVFSR